MNKIDFTNGSQPAINDTNLNQMQANIENAINEKSYINAYLNSKQAISQGDQFLINLTDKEIKGDYFELDASAHTIKILKDCLAIISGTIFVEDTAGDSGYVYLQIKKNNADISLNLENIDGKNFISVTVASKAIELKQNDIIKMTVDYTSDSGNPKIRGEHKDTFLSIVKI